MMRPGQEPLSSDVTLGDVIRLALPFSTQVIHAGRSDKQPINWVTVLADWEDPGSQVQAHDIVLVPPLLQERTPPAALPQHLRTLAVHRVAAAVLFRPVSETLAEATAGLELALLVAPADSSPREVQRAVGSLLLDRQAQTTERGMQLYRRLSELSRDGKGLGAMAELMAQLTGKIVVVQDKRLEIQAMSAPAGNRLPLQPLREILEQRDNLPPLLRNRKAAAEAVQEARVGQSHWQQLLPIENIGRMISPIVSGDRARGYVSVIGPADELDPLDTLVAEQGAAACALEMARDKAVSEAQKALRGDFLEGLLAGTLPPEEIARLERRLDHDTQQPHVVMTFAWGQEHPLSLRRLETAINWLLSSHKLPALVHTYAGSHIYVFQVARDEEGHSSALEFDRRLREHLMGEYPEARLFSGLSGPAETLNEWPQMHQQAVRAMRLGERLGLNTIVEFNSLGVYHLLSQIEHIPAVQRFCEQIIGPLADYDQRQRGSLVETIDAYFSFHGNVSQTAEALFIHRNTLLYRLERIQELTGQDLDRADMRLALQLALKLWQLRPKNES